MSKKKKQKYTPKNQGQETKLPVLVPHEKNNIGRPAEYETKVLPRLHEIEYWGLLGLTNSEMAERLDISESTFYEYQKQFSEFSESVRKNKSLSNAEVAKSLHKKATGQWVEEITEETVEFFINDKGTGKQQLYDVYGNPIMQHIVKKTKKYLPPSEAAAKFWLINRDKKNWKLKENSTEINVNSNNSQTNNTQNINLNHLTVDEIKEKIKHLYQIRSNNEPVIVQDS